VRGTAGAVQGTTVTVDWSRWEVSDGQNQQMGRVSSSPTVVQQHRKLATSTLDDRDRYRVCGVPADVPLHVSVESAGVRGRAQTVRVAPGEVRTLDVATPVRGAVAAAPGAQPAGEPVAVEGVTVVAAPREPRLEAGGFYDRQKMGVGAFHTGSPTIAGRDLPGLIRSSGLQVRTGSRGFGVLAARAMGEDGPCAIPVFIDGVLVPQSRTATLLNTPVAAVEVYRDHTELPPRFREQGACGAVVVWTAPRR